MKKSFMTRVLATGLSLAMAFSLSTATSLVSAGAATKPVLVDYTTGGSGKAVTVNVGEVQKLKMDPTNKTYVVASVKKSSQKIKTAVSKNGKVVYVRGVAATGEKDSAIRASFKVKKTGKISKFTFASKIKVVEPEAPKPTVVKLIGAEQKEAAKIAVTFDNKAVTPGAVSAFKVVRTEGKIVMPVKSVSYDTEKTGATIELYTGVTDGKEYTVTYTDADEAKTVSTATFTATDNKVADLQVSTTSLVAKEVTPVEIKTLDAKGVLLNTYSLTKAAQNKITLDLKSSEGTAYLSGDGIYVGKVGETVTLKATLHTYVYENGVEKDTIPREFTLVGSTEDYASISFGYTIADKKPDFNAASYKQNKVIAKSAQLKFWPNFKKGTKDVAEKFSIESSDSSVLLVADKAVGDLKSANGAAVKGVKEGTAYILVKAKDGNSTTLVASLEVTVGAAPTADTITLSSNSVVTSDAGAETKEVTVKVKDQYTNEQPITELKVECTDTTAKSAAAITKASGKSKIVIDGSKAPAGKTVSYSYKVTAKTAVGTKEAYLSVTINHAGSISDIKNYGLVLSSEDVDLAWSKDATTTGSALEIKVAAYDKDGGLVTYLPLAKSGVAITVQKTTDATKTLAVESGAAAYTKSISTAAVILSAQSKGAVCATGAWPKDPVKKIAEVGTYLVTATFDVDGKTTSFSKQFNVKDTQGTFTFKVANTSKDKWNTSLEKTLEAGDNVSYYIGGVSIDKNHVKVEAVDKDVITGESKYNVKKVTIAYLVDGNGKNNWVYVDAVPADGAGSVVIYSK